MTDPNILAVLDQSAILSFGHAPDVGEVMTMVEEDGGVVALPVACMADAVAAGADPDVLELLARHPVTVLVEDGRHGWLAWGSIRTLVPDLAAASAALIALMAGREVFTRDPDLYAKLDGGGPIVAF